MESVVTILAVAALLLVRVGLPITVLVSLGFILNRWQNQRERSVRQEINQHAR